MPKKAAMEAWKRKRRTEYLEQKEFRYYIFCEGQQTEPQYFNGFKKYIESNPIYKDMVLIEIEPCGAETMRVIGQAEDYVRKNKIAKGQIWCVYDKDSFPAERFNGVIERAEVLNAQNKDVQYHAAWSNECIEFWFLLHFSYYTSNNHRTRSLTLQCQKRTLNLPRKLVCNIAPGCTSLCI
ncbi:RloB family protein [Butyrivibrio sp. LB2008]|uniref:RloB family protein n=1 Tax=Butyrivibrio sp. LB2008 TaxID=1408305 RepID=UPI0009DCBC25|nr:RloB family protein [Butyrivibrio sp. LB2008]